MKLIICVSDYWHHRQWYQIQAPRRNHPETPCIIKILKHSPRQLELKNYQCAGDSPPYDAPATLKLNVDIITYFYLIKELLHFQNYRRILCRYAALTGVQLFWLQIVPPAKEIIDWKWNFMLTLKLWEKIETDYLMSWLSTLGGGYSALGEEFSNCAQVAGKISQRQLRIGIQLGDPFLQSRCLLYYSISLIQTGRLRSAKYIIRKQYTFAKAHEEYDARLIKMCIGIWLRLQYEYGRRIQNTKGRQLENADTKITSIIKSEENLRKKTHN